jgi:hypothetical protein
MRSAPALATAFVVAGIAAPAQAALLWDFSFSDGSNTASGTLTTAAESGGSYDVTGISGQFDGTTITGLQPTGSFFSDSDNLLFPAPEFLDQHGLGFTLQTGGPELIYGAEGGAGYPYFAYNTTDAAGDAGTFSASLAVPEPASTGLIAAALASLALARRRKG